MSIVKICYSMVFLHVFPWIHPLVIPNYPLCGLQILRFFSKALSWTTSWRLGNPTEAVPRKAKTGGSPTGCRASLPIPQQCRRLPGRGLGASGPGGFGRPGRPGGLSWDRSNDAGSCMDLPRATPENDGQSWDCGVSCNPIFWQTRIDHIATAIPPNRLKFCQILVQIYANIICQNLLKGNLPLNKNLITI